MSFDIIHRYTVIAAMMNERHIQGYPGRLNASSHVLGTRSVVSLVFGEVIKEEQKTVSYMRTWASANFLQGRVKEV